MAARLYSLKSQKLRGGSAWFYEDAKGLTVVAELREGAAARYVGTTQAVIPWSKLCAAVDNHRRVKRAQKP